MQAPVLPRRVLTKPSEGTRNEGYDNDNSDLILRVGDTLVNHNPSHGITRHYLIQSMLGQVRACVRACGWQARGGDQGVA
jgi:dual specificity protein kinase YAK1